SNDFEKYQEIEKSLRSEIEQLVQSNQKIETLESELAKHSNCAEITVECEGLRVTVSELELKVQESTVNVSNLESECRKLSEELSATKHNLDQEIARNDAEHYQEIHSKIEQLVQSNQKMKTLESDLGKHSNCTEAMEEFEGL